MVSAYFNQNTGFLSAYITSSEVQDLIQNIEQVEPVYTSDKPKIVFKNDLSGMVSAYFNQNTGFLSAYITSGEVNNILTDYITINNISDNLPDNLITQDNLSAYIQDTKLSGIVSAYFNQNTGFLSAYITSRRS